MNDKTISEFPKFLLYPKKETYKIRILGIDPGTRFTGISIIDVYHDESKYVISAETVNGALLSQCYKPVIKVQGQRFANILAICNRLQFLLLRYAPDIVGIEAPYYNPSMPNAYGALVEAVSSFHLTVEATVPLLQVIKIDPSTIKNTIMVSGGSGDKNLMKVGLFNENLIYSNGLIFDNFDDHTIDSIAAALTCYKLLNQ